MYACCRLSPSAIGKANGGKRAPTGRWRRNRPAEAARGKFSAGCQTKTRLHCLRSGDNAYGWEPDVLWIYRDSAHSFHEVQLEHTRWQASWLMADSDAPPPSHPPERGQWLEPGLKVNLDWRASRQLQWRDRTGFSPDFLFSSPQSRGRAVERTTCGGSQIQLLTAPP